MPAGDVLQLSVDQILYGVPCTNVFQYQVAGEPSDGSDELIDLIEAFDTIVRPAWIAICSEDWNIGCYRSKRLEPSGGTQRIKGVGAEGQGLKTGEALAANSTGLLALYTELAEKKGRGRKFFSGFPKAEETNGTWNLPIGPANTFFTGLIGTITQGGAKGLYEPGLNVGPPFVWWKFEQQDFRAPVHKFRNRTSKVCTPGFA